VRLGFQDNVVVLDVDDDGKGFNIASLEKSARKSWGLLGMEERVSLFGGKLTIQSRVSLGTHVTAVIPYRINPTEEVGDDHTPVAG
jgi:two-component system sensor histidine kinase DegS